MSLSAMLQYLVLPAFSLRWTKIWMRNFIVFKKRIRISAWQPIFEPLFYVLGFGLGLGRFVTEINGVPYIEFVAPGLIASTIMFTASFETTFGTFIRMDFQKTFDAMIATPLRIEDVIVGEVMWGMTKGAISAVMVFVVLSLFGLVNHTTAYLVLPLVFVESFMFAAIGMFVTSLVKAIDYFTYYLSGVMTPMFLFSGIFFPVATLPFWAQKIALALPLTHMVFANRALFLNEVTPFIWVNMAYMLVVSFALFAVSLNIMKKRLIP